MPDISSREVQKNNVQEIIGALSNDQLKDVLKKRKHYQPHAARIAINEALSRGIIHSEDDLLSPEYRTEPLKNKLFPEIEDEKTRNKIRKSISRSMLIAGVLPLIFGIVRFNSGLEAEGSILLIFGVVWMGVSARLIRQMSRSVVGSLALLAASSVIYVVRFLLLQSQVVFIDVFILTVLYLLLAYGLAFVWKLHRLA